MPVTVLYAEDFFARYYADFNKSDTSQCSLLLKPSLQVLSPFDSLDSNRENRLDNLGDDKAHHGTDLLDVSLNVNLFPFEIRGSLQYSIAYKGAHNEHLGYIAVGTAYESTLRYFIPPSK